MGEVYHTQEVFAERRRVIEEDRARRSMEVPEMSDAAVTCAVSPAREMEVAGDVTFDRSQAICPAQVDIVVPSERQIAFANLQSLQFDLEKAIARLKKESDGCSRTIPKFEGILSTLRNCVSHLM